VTQTLSCLILESKSNIRCSRGSGMLQLYTRNTFKSKFLCFLSRTTRSLFRCAVSARFLSEATYHKLQTSNSFIHHLFFFFFLNHCYSLQTPSKPNRHESLHTFYNCHVSIVRMAPEHHERSKALAHPELFLLGAAKGAQNLTWVPRPFAYTAGFLRVSR